MAEGGASPPMSNEALFDMFLHPTKGCLRIFHLLGGLGENHDFTRKLRSAILGMDLSDYSEFFNSFLFSDFDFDYSRMSEEQQDAFYATGEGRIREFFTADGCTLPNLILGVQILLNMQLRHAQRKMNRLMEEIKSGKRKATKEAQKNIDKIKKIINESDYESSIASVDSSTVSGFVSHPGHKTIASFIDYGPDFELESVTVESTTADENGTLPPTNGKLPTNGRPSTNGKPPKNGRPSTEDETSSSDDEGLSSSNKTPTIDNVTGEKPDGDPDFVVPEPPPKKRKRKKKKKQIIIDKFITISSETFNRWINRPPKKRKDVILKLKAAIEKKKGKDMLPAPGCKALLASEDFMRLWNERMRDPIRQTIDDDFPPLFDLNTLLVQVPDEEPPPSPPGGPGSPGQTTPPNLVDRAPQTPTPGSPPPLSPLKKIIPAPRSPRCPGPPGPKRVPPSPRPRAPPTAIKPLSPLPSSPGEPDPVPDPVLDPIPDSVPDPTGLPLPPSPTLKKYLIDGVRYDFYSEQDLINKLVELRARRVELTLEAVAPVHNTNKYGAVRVFNLLGDMRDSGHVDLDQDAETKFKGHIYITINENYEGHQEVKARELGENIDGN